MVSIHARQQWRANRPCAGPIHVDGVSIHARQQWRANRDAATAVQGDIRFQSTPASNGGRIVAVAARRGYGQVVSIHARQQWRANQGAGLDDARFSQFQSTPASNGGRIPMASQCRASLHWFQSTPASNGGRIHTMSIDNQRTLIVSIHARQQWRANPGCHCLTPLRSLVSIHARQQWRANPGCHCLTPLRSLVSIHARQQWRANPAWCEALRFCRACFNPRPPAMAGESTGVLSHFCGQLSFNPRPPAMAGESRAIGTWRPYFLFQSTPASNGGRIFMVFSPIERVEVSIHARQQWRANRDKHLIDRVGGCFNPRPPAMAGESGCELPLT